MLHVSPASWGWQLCFGPYLIGQLCVWSSLPGLWIVTVYKQSPKESKLHREIKTSWENCRGHFSHSKPNPQEPDIKSFTMWVNTWWDLLSSLPASGRSSRQHMKPSKSQHQNPRSAKTLIMKMRTASAMTYALMRHLLNAISTATTIWEHRAVHSKTQIIYTQHMSFATTQHKSGMPKLSFSRIVRAVW